VSRATETVESTRAAFASMGQSEWDAMMESSHSGAWLTPTEQEGLKLAILDRARRKLDAEERFPYRVTEADLAGTTYEFCACSDPFTAERECEALAKRIGRWGCAFVSILGREDEHFNEDEQTRFFDRLDDAALAAFVSRVGVVFAGDRQASIDEFYVRFYGGESC
jgi:hypothetical protein